MRKLRTPCPEQFVLPVSVGELGARGGPQQVSEIKFSGPISKLLEGAGFACFSCQNTVVYGIPGSPEGWELNARGPSASFGNHLFGAHLKTS